MADAKTKMFYLKFTSYSFLELSANADSSASSTSPLNSLMRFGCFEGSAG